MNDDHKDLPALSTEAQAAFDKLSSAAGLGPREHRALRRLFEVASPPVAEAPPAGLDSEDAKLVDSMTPEEKSLFLEEMEREAPGYTRALNARYEKEALNKLQADLERAKEDRNRAGVEERRKYLPELQRMKARITLLEEALNQACHTTAFLDNVASGTEGYTYRYPEDTERELAAWRKLVPARPTCGHSVTVKDCPGCLSRLEHNRGVVEAKKILGEAHA